MSTLAPILKGDTMTIHAEIINLTPDLAEELIGINTANRRLGIKNVAGYAKQMQDGLWSDGVAVIAVSTDGRLVNGQHVCHAVVNSGHTVKAIMVTGVAPQSFAAFDSHGKRTTGQTLSLAGVSNANAVAAIIRRVAVVDNNSANVKVSNSETNAIYNSDPQRWDMISELASEIYRCGRKDKLGMSAAAIGVFLVCADDKRQINDAYEFAMSVADIANHETGAPRTALRRWITNTGRGGSGRIALTEHSAWLRAWNAHAEGRTLAKLYASSDSIPSMSTASRNAMSA